MVQHRKYIIEDRGHVEFQAEYASFEDALNELKKRSTMPWDKEPNVAPCISWHTCGRNYEILEYNTTNIPWELIKRPPALEVFSKEVKWLIDVN